MFERRPARTPRDYVAVLDTVLGWSAGQDWRGYDKHDALNSPLLETLCGRSRIARLLATQAVMRSPVNLRGMLGAARTHNPKGLALFVMGLLDMHAVDGAAHRLDRVRELVGLLDRLAVPTASGGRAWGYQYPWQDLGFFAPRGTPNAVVTAFVCEALLAAYRVTRDATLLDRVGAAVPFFLGDLQRLKDTPEELCLSYMPLPMTMRVMDVSILIAAVLAQHAQLSGEAHALPDARRLATYVVRRQTTEGAWFYTDPPGDSPIRHDNYHTGFILDALDRYCRAADERGWDDVYRAGLAFYAERLFEADGAPRWMSDRSYPHDIHGAAQGILTFSRHLDVHGDLAHRIADWALTRMYHPAGRFYHQRTRWYTKTFTQLRWCNAWMVRGLAALARGMSHETNRTRED